MNKENDIVRTRTIENVNQCRQLIVDAIGTKQYLVLEKHIRKTINQLKLYDKELGYGNEKFN